MSNTQFSPSIDSRPVYSGLSSAGSAPAIMVADAHGSVALSDLAGADASVMDQAHVLLVTTPPEMAEKLAALQPVSIDSVPDLDAATPAFLDLLNKAKMGTQLYLSGSEGLIGYFSARALENGVPSDAIQSEHRGPITRRMQCVHCKGITEDVTTDPFNCSNCGLTLFVRDHFSRRLGVFQGVCVDAETPGEVPETVEIKA